MCLGRFFAVLVQATMLAGCVSDGAAVSNDVPPALVAPLSLSDAQIAQVIETAHLSYIQQARTMAACSTHVGVGAPVTDGSIVATSQSPVGYSAWLEYVAEHLRTDTGFGTDYTDIADHALDVNEFYNPRSALCQTSRTKDTQVLQALLQAKPAQIGQQLFREFTVYDQATRERAAAAILNFQ
jgi:hypothetical protein